MINLKNIFKRNINLIISPLKLKFYSLNDAIFIEMNRGFNESKA